MYVFITGGASVLGYAAGLLYQPKSLDGENVVQTVAQRQSCAMLVAVGGAILGLALSLRFHLVARRETRRR